MVDETYDTIIIGGGPAGAAAAVYAARKKLRTLIIAEEFGGKSIVSAGIQNWLGEISISGIELAAKLENHVRAQAGVDVVTAGKAAGIKTTACGRFEIVMEDGGSHGGRSLIVATGARKRYLNVPGEKEFAGKGVAYCSTCDAPFFQDLDVAVVGGGNAALETAMDLTTYARRIFLLLRSEILRGDPVTQEKVMSSSKVQVIPHTRIAEIKGDKAVSGVVYRDKRENIDNALDVQGVFIAIGSIPNSEFLNGMVATNHAGEIVIDCKTARTSVPGIFAAGDVTDDPFKQNNIAAGDGVKAALSAYNYLRDLPRHSPCDEPR